MRTHFRSYVCFIICLSYFCCQSPDTKLELYAASDFTPEDEFTSGIEGPATDADGNIYAVNFKEQGTIGQVTKEGKSSLYEKLT